MNATARAIVLKGAIAISLLSLAWPVMVVLALQTFGGLAETYFVSFLGTHALAGVAVVFPLFMLMTEQLLQLAYAAFNACDINAALEISLGV
jgi:Na+-driven multidrug efflux pump